MWTRDREKTWFIGIWTKGKLFLYFNKEIIILIKYIIKKKKDEKEKIGESEEDDGFSLVEAMKETDTFDSKQN